MTQRVSLSILLCTLAALTAQAQWSKQDSCSNGWRRHPQPGADIAQQLPGKGVELVEGMTAGAKKDQLDGGPGAAVTPEFLVDRDDIALGQREVAVDVEL